MILDADYAYVLFALADSYTETGDVSEALIYVSQALEVYEKLNDSSYLICIELLGSIRYQLGDLPQALSYYQQYSLAQNKRLKAGINIADAKECLAHSYQLLGRVYISLGDYNAAEQSLKKSKGILLKFRNNTEVESRYIEALAVCYERLGEVYYARGENRRALHAYNIERRLFENLYTASSEIQNKFGLAIVYSKIGELKMYCGRHKHAEPFFRAFNDLMLEICAEYKSSIKYALNLAWSYQFLGMFYIIEQDSKSAYSFFKLMLGQFEHLIQKNSSNVEYINGLATSFAKLGETLTDMQEYSQAYYYYRKRVEMMEDLCARYPLHPEFNNNLSGSYSHLGETLLLLGEIDEAIVYHQKERALSEMLCEKFKDNTEYGINTAITYCKLGSCYLQKADYNLSVDFFEKYLRHTQILLDSDAANVDFLGNYAEALVAHAAANYLLTGTMDAKSCFQANSIWSKLYRQSNNRQYQQKIAILKRIETGKENIASLILELCSF